MPSRRAAAQAARCARCGVRRARARQRVSKERMFRCAAYAMPHGSNQNDDRQIASASCAVWGKGGERRQNANDTRGNAE